MMAFSILKHVLSLFLLFTFLHEPASALRKTYVVYMGGHSHGPDPSPSDLETATNSHHDLLASVSGSHEMGKEAMMYSYNKHINGFAAMLEEEEASEIAKNPNVVSIFLSKEHKLLTTRSWDFLGLEKNGRIPANSAWKQARFGENIIIANIDSGVWPEHPSFSDKGYNYGPIPSKWRGNGVCEIDHYNGSNTHFCNRKLIGARVFLKNYEAQVEKVEAKHRSARDFFGHGSHTLSTAGGNFVRGAQVEGNGNGTAKGGSPRARLVAYKACWDDLNGGGCQDADIVQAFDHAIQDGVDIISISLGPPQPYSQALFTDGTSIGSFHAVANNIVVVSSAGNDGPAPSSVTNVAPWAFTVAASTMDRDFLSKISLGNNKSILGASLNRGLSPSSPSNNKLYPMINSVDARLPHVSIDDARLCKPGTIDPKKVSGKVLVCLRGDKLASAKETEVGKRAGAVAVLVENDKDSGQLLLPENSIIHSASVRETNYTHGDYKTAHINSMYKNMFAYLDDAKTYIGVQPAPILIAGHTGNSSHSDNTTTSPRAKHKRGTDRGNSSHSDNTTTSPRAKHKRGTDTGMHENMFAYLDDAKTYIGVKPAPMVAGFSSRGPSAVQPLILKPDITAPGVSIIAAFSQAAGPSNLKSDRRRVLFNLQHGTSMSCPHVAGVAGLVKTYHPDWSPAAIKSAIMTTATTLDTRNKPIKDAFDKVATPFEYGAGHIQPNSSLHPGLVYDLTTTDYLNFLCASNYNQALLKFFGTLNSSYTCPKSYRIEDFNYPSITVPPPVSKSVTVTRTVTNVGPPSTYVVNTLSPKGIKVIVQPSSLTFKRTGEKKRFQVILKTIGVSRREFPSFGSLSWTDGMHRVTSPIVVLDLET